jgi:hypothetical protein
MSGVLNDAAEKLGEVVASLQAIDLDDEVELIQGIVASAETALGEIEAQLRDYAAVHGDAQSLPSGAEVANVPEAEEPAAEETVEPAAS